MLNTSAGWRVSRANRCDQGRKCVVFGAFLPVGAPRRLHFMSAVTSIWEFLVYIFFYTHCCGMFPYVVEYGSMHSLMKMSL